MSVSYGSSVPVVSRMHYLRDDLAQIDRGVMETMKSKFDSEVEWLESDDHALLEKYAEAHPDELVSFSNDGLRKLKSEVGIR